jgi:hypothetical protein
MEGNMKAVIVAAALAALYMVLNVGPAFSQGGLLTPAQRRAYHACLYGAWVHDYCRENSRAFPACVAAFGGANFPLDGRRFTDEYCWFAAQDLTH